MYIERVTHQMGSGKRVRVATSDGLVQMIILGHGALRISARSFRLEVDEAIQTLRSYLEQQT
jgi:predicted RNA-binding protein with PIN domain